MIRFILSLLRREQRMGAYLRKYETARYTDQDLYPGRYSATFGMPANAHIIIPSDAEKFADVSFWQGVMNWTKYILNSLYVIVRISQNVWVDTQFENNYVNGHAAGVKQGGYIFYDDRVSPQAQANTALAALKGRELEGDLVVDWEVNYGGAYFGLKYVIDLIKILKASNVKCKRYLIYTGYYFWVENSSATNNAAEYKYITDNNIGLWIAWYASASVVRIPAPWTTWVYWQFGTPAVGLEWGANTKEIDMNYSNGKLDIGTPPPTGGTMYRCIKDVSYRNSPAYYSSTVLGTLRVGDVVHGNMIYTPSDTIKQWVEFTRIERADGTIVNIHAYCSGYPAYVEEVPDTPPSTDVYITKIIKNESFDVYYSDGSIQTWRANDIEYIKDA